MKKKLKKMLKVIGVTLLLLTIAIIFTFVCNILFKIIPIGMSIICVISLLYLAYSMVK